MHIKGENADVRLKTGNAMEPALWQGMFFQYVVTKLFLRKISPFR